MTAPLVARSLWEQRYSAADDLYGTEPDDFLRATGAGIDAPIG